MCARAKQSAAYFTYFSYINFLFVVFNVLYWGYNCESVPVICSRTIGEMQIMQRFMTAYLVIVIATYVIAIKLLSSRFMTTVRYVCEILEKLLHCLNFFRIIIN